MNDDSNEVHHQSDVDEDGSERRSLMAEDHRQVPNGPRKHHTMSADETGSSSEGVASDGEDGRLRGPSSSTGWATPFVLLLTLLSALGGFLFGYDTGVVAAALLLLKEPFGLSSVWQEAFVSVTMAFAAVFSIVSGFMNDRLGRKPTIVLASAVFTVGALLLATATKQWMLIAGRSILGVGIGFASSTISMYIAECAPSHMRGQLVTFNNAFITGGQFVASVVGGIFSKDTVNGWRYMLGLAAVPAVIQFVGFLFMPETPRFLMMKGRKDEARRLLERIRGQEDVEWEINEIEKDVEDSESSILRMLSTPHVRRALFVGCMLQFIQQITGINSVMYYSATIIQMSGVSSTSSAIWLASITAAVNFLFTFLGFFLVERIGRRPLTLVSLTGVMFSLIFLAVGFQLAAYNSPSVDVVESVNETDSCSNYTSCNSCMLDNHCGYCYEAVVHDVASNGSCLGVSRDALGFPVPGRSAYGRCGGKPAGGRPKWAYGFCPSSFSWMATAGLVLYLVFFAPGMGPMPWTMNSEIYPIWARSKGNSIATCVNWLSNLVISMTFLSLTEAITRYGAFYLYSSFAAVGIIFVALCVPETKGKPLEEVEELFRKPLPVIRCGGRERAKYESIVNERN